MLAAMSGQIYLARKRSARIPEVYNRLVNLDESVSAAAVMVKQLMAFVHKGMAMKENLSLSELLYDAVDIATLGMPDDVHVHVDFCSDDLVVYGDRSALQQVCINLMVNARDALAGKEKHIDVSLRRMACDPSMAGKVASDVEAVACLRVKDNGTGISSDLLEHIFEPFFTTKAVDKGTGLGLSMSLGTVESHGGWIDVESSPGQGTVFDIYIPLLAKGDMLLIQTLEGPVAEGCQELILFVDDQPVLRKVGKSLLSELGYRVLLAENGIEALEQFEAHADEVKLIITDVMMPNMSGVELYRALREQQLSVPVLFVSGYDAGDLHLPVAGDYKVLQKPYSVSECSKLIRALVEHPRG